MDYQCECGEKFDIYGQIRFQEELVMDQFGETVRAYFSAKCPKCNKVVKCVEIFEYKRTKVVE